MRHKLTLLSACACVLFAALVGSAQLRADTGTDPDPTTTTSTTAEPDVTQRDFQQILDTYRHETWRWQRLMGHPLTRQLGNPHAERADKIAAWKRLATEMRRRAQNPPHKRQWLCIHHFEGAWNDPNAPYYGVLQMDLSFQRAYGGHLLARKGTADHWTPLEQMWAAARAHGSVRGVEALPSTAQNVGPT